MWKYCDSIFQLGFFIFYIVFLSFISFSPIHISFLFSFSCFSPPHKCLVSTPISIPPSFIFFFTSRTFQQTHLLHIKEEREREERDYCSFAAPPLVEIEVAERTKLVEISVHHATLPCSLPHCRSSSSPSPGWVRSTCSLFFFLFACSDSTLF